MKSHFLKLFDYDQYANRIMLEMMHKAKYPAKTLQLMNHLLTAQQVWYNRCNDLPLIAGTLWGNEFTEVSFDTIDSNHKNWAVYLNGLEESAFEDIVTYKNSTGNTYTDKLDDICTHVINHGTHHRAQIGWELKIAGLEKLPFTDYIFYLRDI